MINTLNKLLTRFGFQLISIKPDMSLVEATVKFMNDHPNLFEDGLGSEYIGDINYVKEKVNGEFPQVSGKTYYKSQPSQYEKYFCDYNADEKPLSKEDLKKIYDETTFTTEQLKNKLK